MISLSSVRASAKQLAQNKVPTGATGVQLLLTDPDDYTLAVRQALEQFSRDKGNDRVVDHTVTVAGFRVVLKGSGALASLTGADAFSVESALLAVWLPFDATSQGQAPLDPNSWRVVKDPGGKLVLELLADQLVVGQVLRLQFTRPHTLTEAPNTVSAPTAPSAALMAPAAAGNVDDGAHSWAVTFVTAQGETEASAGSSPVTVADQATNGQVTVAIPVSADPGVTARNIYRTVAGDTGVKKLAGTVLNNTVTTFTDNVADANLGADAPSTNTAGGANSVDDDHEQMLVTLAASMVLQLAAVKAVQNTGNTGLPNDVVDRRTQSDQFRSRAKELRDLYAVLAGKGGDKSSLSAVSGWGDMDTEFSDGRGFLWPRERAF